MPTFDTPDPISVTLDLFVGAARIRATDEPLTVVEVRPSDPANAADVEAAEQTRVEYAGGRLLIKSPRRRSLFGNARSSVELTVELPAGSRVHADGGAAEIWSEGRLGDCRLKVDAGAIRLDETGAARLQSGLGDVSAERVAGNAEVMTGAGTIRLGEVDGTVAIKNSNGDTWIGEVSGDVRARSANGNIVVDRAHAGVEARTAFGSIRILDAARGAIGLGSSAGELEIGVREGSAAWLDVRSRFGRVLNSLTAADSPGGSDETVEVRARTSYGNVLIHRA